MNLSRSLLVLTILVAPTPVLAQDTLIVEDNEVQVLGNLGIGASPSHGFHLQLPDPNVVITDTSGDGSVFLIAARDTVSFFGTATPDNFAIRVNNQDVMRFTTAKRVGINTASPTESLHVVGNIRIEGGSLMPADYVFSPDYALMPLADLRTFVAENRHLPNLPSGADIEKSGVDLGGFQMDLLEKVEELVLYTLDQEARLAALEKRNDDIARRNAELEVLARRLMTALDERSSLEGGEERPLAPSPDGLLPSG